MAKLADADVCVNCYVRFQDAATKRELIDQQQAALQMSMVNHLTDYMWSQIGLPAPHRLEIPQLVKSLGDSIVTNTFNIENSVIGVLSAGQNNSLKSIAVHLQALQAPEQLSVANALKSLTAAVAKSDLSPTLKTQALEQLEELAGQAARQPPERSKASTLSLVLDSLQGALSAGGSLAEIWSTWGPLLRTFFGA